MNRRQALAMSTVGVAGLFVWRYAAKSSDAPGDGIQSVPTPPTPVSIVEFSDAGQSQGVSEVLKVVKTEDQWRKQLSRVSFAVTRHADTELAYTGPYWKLHDHGLYRCVCCDTALFSSETKFDSGTGWPSFWAPLAKENVEEHEDRSLGLARIAVTCHRCDAHLGHLFDDGPKPTGLRYCMNSASLRFIKA